MDYGGENHLVADYGYVRLHGSTGQSLWYRLEPPKLNGRPVCDDSATEGSMRKCSAKILQFTFYYSTIVVRAHFLQNTKYNFNILYRPSATGSLSPWIPCQQ